VEGVQLPGLADTYQQLHGGHIAAVTAAAAARLLPPAGAAAAAPFAAAGAGAVVGRNPFVRMSLGVFAHPQHAPPAAAVAGRSHSMHVSSDGSEHSMVRRLGSLRLLSLNRMRSSGGDEGAALGGAAGVGGDAAGRAGVVQGDGDTAAV
jgi:hypothetical protein